MENENEEEFYDAQREDSMFLDSPQYDVVANDLESEDGVERLARILRETKEDFHYSISSDEEEPDQVTAGVNIWEFEIGAYLLDGYWDTSHSTDPLSATGNTVVVRAKGQPGYLPREVLEEAQSMLFVGLDNMNDQMIPVAEEDVLELHNMCQQFHYTKDGNRYQIT